MDCTGKQGRVRSCEFLFMEVFCAFGGEKKASVGFSCVAKGQYFGLFSWKRLGGFFWQKVEGSGLSWGILSVFIFFGLY